MRYLLLLSLLLCFFACKKEHGEPTVPTNTDSTKQSIVYKTIATVRSPADSASGFVSDSLRVSRTVGRNETDFFNNITYVGSDYDLNYGFSIGYDDPSKPYSYFMFTAAAFPTVPYEPELNRTYEQYTYLSDPVANQRPMFLGTSTGEGGMTYFVNNVYPDDVTPIVSKTYSAVTFSKKMKIPLPSTGQPDTAFFASGHIYGYCIDYYKSTDTAKYKHRSDFTVDFTDLRIHRYP